jgi:predicted nuclease with TOPRIM domain
VLYLRRFTYESKTGGIVQERVKKMLVMKGDTISVVTRVPVIGDVREDILETTRVGYAFMDTNINNIQRLCKQNEKKELKIKELEEKLQQMKVDEGSLQSFKVSANKVRNYLEGSIIDIYAHLSLFQDATSIVINQNN